MTNDFYPRPEDIERVADNYPLKFHGDAVCIFDEKNSSFIIEDRTSTQKDERWLEVFFAHDNPRNEQGAVAMAISIVHSTNYYPAMLDMLKQLEWPETTEREDTKRYYQCSICKGYKEDGHKNDCSLDQLLNKLTVSR